MNNYATIKDIEIGHFLIDGEKKFKRMANSSHHSLGRVRVFELQGVSENIERRLFPKSKDDQRVLVIDSQTFAL